MFFEQKSLGYSFYEVCEILQYMPIEWNERLPEKLKKLMRENKINHNFVYNKEQSLDKQDVLRETKILLSILYRTYWCSNEERKELEEADENILREKYNPENIFKQSAQK